MRSTWCINCVTTASNISKSGFLNLAQKCTQDELIRVKTFEWALFLAVSQMMALVNAGPGDYFHYKSWPRKSRNDLSDKPMINLHSDRELSPFNRETQQTKKWPLIALCRALTFYVVNSSVHNSRSGDPTIGLYYARIIRLFPSDSRCHEINQFTRSDSHLPISLGKNDFSRETTMPKFREDGKTFARKSNRHGWSISSMTINSTGVIR